MVLSETVAYVSVFGLTIVFTAFALAIQDKFWKIALKITAAIFWMVMAVIQFSFMGSDSILMILSLPYAIFGMLFIFSMIHDFLAEKKERIWKFDE